MICGRLFFVVAIGLLLTVGVVESACADTRQLGAEKFINSLAHKAVASLSDKLASREMRINRFRAMFRKSFAVRSIGKFVLGRNWKITTKDEQKTYLALFDDLMVISYVDRFAKYAGSELTVTKSRDEAENIVTVFSIIGRSSDSTPIEVNWKVGHSGPIFRILDVVVEGVSMSATLRSDFNSIIRRNTKGIAGLLDEMRIKIAALKAEAAK
jgi:phospholipid transport system substrate-binding protein